MKILLTSATLIELEGILSTMENLKCLQKDFFRGFAGNNLLDIRVSGVGAVATTEKLTRILEFSRYDLVMNVGICGSFRHDFALGSIVSIEKDIWGDLGAENNEEFSDLFDLGLLDPGELPFTKSELVNPGNRYSPYFSRFTKVKGLTVNKSHGKLESIEKVVKKYKPDIETMESAAIFSLCISREINFQCLRSISNFVEPRNRQSWDIHGAIKNLSIEINKILVEISK